MKVFFAAAVSSFIAFAASPVAAAYPPGRGDVSITTPNCADLPRGGTATAYVNYTVHQPGVTLVIVDHLPGGDEVLFQGPAEIGTHTVEVQTRVDDTGWPLLVASLVVEGVDSIVAYPVCIAGPEPPGPPTDSTTTTQAPTEATQPPAPETKQPTTTTTTQPTTAQPIATQLTTTSTTQPPVSGTTQPVAPIGRQPQAPAVIPKAGSDMLVAETSLAITMIVVGAAMHRLATQ